MYELRKTMYLFVLCLSVIVMHSCNKGNNKADNISNTNVSAYGEIDLSNFVEGSLLDEMECRYVKLETNEKCMITSIVKLQLVDSLIFILDSKQNLFEFDLNGKYLRTISCKGGSMSEYVKLFDFFVDKKKKQISIIDFPRCDCVYFGYEGEYLSRVKIDEELINDGRSCLLMNNKLVFENTTHVDSKGNYTIYDLVSKKKEYVLPFMVQSNLSLSLMRNRFCMHKNVILATTFLSDTIYVIGQDGVSVKCVVRGKHNYCKKSDFGGPVDEFDAEFNKYLVDNNLSFGLSKIFLSDSILVFSYLDGCLLTASYDLSSKKGKITSRSSYYTSILYSDDSCFVASRDMDDLLMSVRYNLCNDSRLKTLISHSKDIDNPILAIYTHKHNEN